MPQENVQLLIFLADIFPSENVIWIKLHLVHAKYTRNTY